VTDVVRANLLAAKADVADWFYNLGRAVGTCVDELVEEILRLTASTLGVEHQPAGQTFVTNRIGRTDRAKCSLGFEAHTNVRQGLQQLLQCQRRPRYRFVSSVRAALGITGLLAPTTGSLEREDRVHSRCSQLCAS
jgi:UDP-glucose 4-epimerase